MYTALVNSLLIFLTLGNFQDTLRPMLQYVTGYLMSTLMKHKTPRSSITQLMTGQTAKLVMFMTMSPQVDVMTKTKGDWWRM